MKIHKLKIENIASLKGEHLVDFDQFQMDFGSFAITGDTGAGKSTILNCISLALYGKNYRKGIIPTDLITLGESVGRVELIFSSSGNVYHRIWECRVRKKNGEYLKKPVPQNEFYLVQGDKKEVLDIAPEDVIHLTFDQFCKTIILNQGQFSKFLTSGFKDRKDILEKLYHGEKLNGFNPLLREKINALIAGTEQIEAEMSGLTQNFHPDITQEGLKNVEAAHQKAQKVFSFMQELSCDLKDTCSLSSQIEQSSLKLKELVSKAQQQVKEINNLALQRKEFSGEHQEFKEKCKTRAPALHQASQYQKTLIKLRQDSKELAAGLDDLNKSSEEAARAADANTEIRNKLDENLKTLKENPLYKDLKESDFENFKREYQHWVGACQELKSLQTVDSHDKRNIELLENEIKNFGEKLEQITDALGVLEQRTTRSNLKTLEQKLYELHELEARLSSFQREAARIKQASQSSAMQLEKCRQAINELEKADIELEKKLELQKDAAKSVRYEGAKLLCLEQSLERQSCVVCDNDDISHLDQNKMEKSFSKLEVYEKDMERSEQEKTSLFQRLEKERTAQKALQASLAQDKERLLTLRGEFISRNHERAGEFQLSEKTLEKQEASRLLETAKDRIKSSIQAGQEDQLEINSLQEKFKAFSSQRDKTRGKLKTLRDEAKERRAKLDEIDKRRKDLEARLQKWAGLERFQETAPNFLQLQEDFFKLVQKQSLAQVEARHLKQRLEDMRRRALQQREQKRKIESESAELVKNIKQASPDMDPQEALEELEKEKDLFEFKNRKFDEDLKELEIEKSAIFSRKQTFSEQLKEQDALLLIHWRQLCELLRKRLGPQKELKTSCLELSKLLEQIANLETPCDKETLLLCQELALKEASLSKAAMEERKDNLTEYKTLLARQNSAQEKIRELQKELERAKALKSEWEELYQLIGKDEFRNYILAMVEKLLIQQTNLELAKLCDGRYLIQHKKTSSKLAPDFYIIDKFRGEEVRKVSTLSGGETFMVSLAMALALAELTRGNADLDSFFIDEGFGSLDQDSLEEALEMLQDIETRGKQIGLISHVKELTQRIPVNIHLQKNRLGNSSIEILYN